MFRLKTEAGSEVLFQADNEAGLTQWVQVVESAINAKDPRSSGSGQQGSSSSSSNRKLTSSTATRNRSPTGQSPVSKNRKASAGKLLIFFFFLSLQIDFELSWIRINFEFELNRNRILHVMSTIDSNFFTGKKIHHPKGHDVVSMTHFPYYLG